MSNPVRDPLVAWTAIEEEIAAMSSQTSVLHQLNSTGSFIWHHLTGENSIEDISRMLSEEFEVELEKARVDVREFLSLLESEKLVTFRDRG